MNKIFSVLVLSLFLAPTLNLSAEEKRTDGKPGSEYGDFSSWDGEFRIGAEFGALLPTASSGKTTFGLGLDFDYRPFDVFGVRANYLQGVQSPRTSLISVTPMVHRMFSNLLPYAFVGPGIAITNVGETEAKFLVAFGVGADVVLVEHFAIGMLWSYHSVIDASDIHALTARFSYRF